MLSLLCHQQHALLYNTKALPWLHSIPAVSLPAGLCITNKCLLLLPIACKHVCYVMQIFCDVGNGVLEEHSIDVLDEGCSPILHNDPILLHTHGPGCGHERVLHW